MSFHIIEYQRKVHERKKKLLKTCLQVSVSALRIAVTELRGLEETPARPRRQRSCQTRPWLQRRPLYGQYEHLLQELKDEDPKGFKVFQRLSPELWTELYDKVGPRIERKTTMMREPISAGLRLAITLRYLATGDSYQSQMFGFRVADNTICGIIPETCQVIYEVLADDYFKVFV